MKNNQDRFYMSISEVYPKEYKKYTSNVGNSLSRLYLRDLEKAHNDRMKLVNDILDLTEEDPLLKINVNVEKTKITFEISHGDVDAKKLVSPNNITALFMKNGTASPIKAEEPQLKRDEFIIEDFLSMKKLKTYSDEIIKKINKFGKEGLKLKLKEEEKFEAECSCEPPKRSDDIGLQFDYDEISVKSETPIKKKKRLRL